MPLDAARYREFAPCEALRDYVRAFFTFAVPPENAPLDRAMARRLTREVAFCAGQPFWSRLFADGRVSMVFSFGSGYRVDGL